MESPALRQVSGAFAVGARTASTCRFCRHSNPPQSKFCNECGSPVGLQPCPACDAINAGDGIVCHACAAPLGDATGGLAEAEAKLAGLQREQAPAGVAVAVTVPGAPFPLPLQAEGAGREAARFRADAPGASPAPDPLRSALAGGDAGFALPRRGARRGALGRRSQRPVLVLLAVAVLAVPYALTRWSVDPPRPTAATVPFSARPLASAGPAAAAVAVATDVDVPGTPPGEEGGASQATPEPQPAPAPALAAAAVAVAAPGAAPSKTVATRATPVATAKPRETTAAKRVTARPAVREPVSGHAGTRSAANAKPPTRTISAGSRSTAPGARAPARAAGAAPSDRCPRGTSPLAGCIPGA